MNQLLQDISQLPYISTGTPLSVADIADYQSKLLAHDFPLIPKEYQKFLLSYNGIMFQGNIVFGLSPNDNPTHDLLGENVLYALPDYQDTLLIGASETILICWQKSKNTYQMIDKNNFMMLHEFENFSSAIRYILRIND